MANPLVDKANEVLDKVEASDTLPEEVLKNALAEDYVKQNAEAFLSHLGTVSLLRSHKMLNLHELTSPQYNRLFRFRKYLYDYSF